MIKKITCSDLFENCQQPLPVSFKVIGIGNSVSDIIEKVTSFGYDCVSCFIANTPSDCIPMDNDEMVIIVARDNEDVANAIAKTYHEAGVLTIGLVHNADLSCYDSIVADKSFECFPEVIKCLLQPIVTQGFICYDFNDLCHTLRDSQFFKTLAAEGKSVEEAVNNMKDKLAKIPVQHIEALSAHLLFKHERHPAVTMADIKHLSDLISSLPESIDVIWSVNFDDTLPDDLISFTIIISGKEL